MPSKRSPPPGKCGALHARLCDRADKKLRRPVDVNANDESPQSSLAKTRALVNTNIQVANPVTPTARSAFVVAQVGEAVDMDTGFWVKVNPSTAKGHTKRYDQVQSSNGRNFRPATA
eukprot:1051015-Amphidinium_carterae.1